MTPPALAGETSTSAATHRRRAFPSRSFGSPAERPPPDLNLVLQVVVVGGGVVGLYFSLLLAAALRGRVRIRIYDGRWVQEGSAISWRRDVQRVQHIVTMPSSSWLRLNEKEREQLFPPGSFIEQWPLRQGSQEGAGFARNIAIDEFEDKLLAMAQGVEYAGCLALCPKRYDSKEHARLKADEDEAFHVIALADGAEATSARDGLFGGSDLGAATAIDSPGCLPQELATIIFELEEEARHLNVADCTLVSLAQRRYFLNVRDERRGSLHVRLTADELRQEKVDVGEHGPGGDAADGSVGILSQDALEGLRLFGVSEADVRSTQRLRSKVSEREFYHLTLRDLHTPGRAEGMDSPCAFLLGEAADVVDPGPGRGISTAMQGAADLVDLVMSIQQCLATGWPVEASRVERYTRRMKSLQQRESRAHLRRYDTSLRSGAGGLGGRGGSAFQASEETTLADAPAFFAAVRSVSRQLGEKPGLLPPARLAELSEVDELCHRLSGSGGLTPAVCSTLQASGSWAADEFSVLGELSSALSLNAAQKRISEESVLNENDPNLSPKEAKKAYNRGVRLLKGIKGEEKDETSAAEAFWEAAASGHKEAQYVLGVMLLKGQGLPKQEGQAAKWFALAAEQGHPKAQYNLSIMHQFGVGTAKDAAAAQALMYHAARQSHKKAMRSHLVENHGLGRWFDYDPKELGVERIERDANGGDPDAQCRLGLMFFDGDHVPEDKAMASNWFMKAAQQGHAEAQMNMARLLLEGDGVEQDIEYGMRFLEMSAEQGHVLSQFNLANRLFNDNCDLERAAFWFLRSAKQGFAPAQASIGWMMFTGNGIPRDLPMARRWLQAAAEQGNTEGQMYLKQFNVQ